MSNSQPNKNSLPAIKVDGVAYLPLLPGVRAFDVESVASLETTITSPIIPSSNSSQTTLVSERPPTLPVVSPLTSFSDDIFGREGIVEEDVPKQTAEPEYERPATAEVSQYSTMSLPATPSPAKIFDEVLETLGDEVLTGQAEYVWKNGYDIEKEGHHVSRTGSIDTIFSFAPSEADKEAIVAKWRARVDKRGTLNMTTLVEEPKQREEQASAARTLARSAEAKRNYRRKRTSRTLGTLSSEPAQ
jgi:hypothetical protein